MNLIITVEWISSYLAAAYAVIRQSNHNVELKVDTVDAVDHADLAFITQFSHGNETWEGTGGSKFQRCR